VTTGVKRTAERTDDIRTCRQLMALSSAHALGGIADYKRSAIGDRKRQTGEIKSKPTKVLMTTHDDPAEDTKQ
jgi:hypothetical protein